MRISGLEFRRVLFRSPRAPRRQRLVLALPVFRVLPARGLGGLEAVRRRAAQQCMAVPAAARSEEHTSELQSLMRNSYAVFCMEKKKHSIREHEINDYQFPSTHSTHPAQQTPHGRLTTLR